MSVRSARALLTVLALSSSSAPAAAQFFSPGPLAKAHAALDGVASCKQCHFEGDKHDNSTCLTCHKEIARRIDADAGYHGTVKTRLCASCHKEHKGREAQLVQWQPSRDAFNHKLTGWPLEGAHKKAECKTCHEPRRIADAAVRKLERETYLGLSAQCTRCHFDEHRGQVGARCQSCHAPTAPFAQAPGFDHDDADFRLTGKHAPVKCKSCHVPLTDRRTPASAWPAPRSSEYRELTDIPHGTCLDCHADPHAGKHGAECARCHSAAGWKVIRAEGVEDKSFHDKHAFPLRGAHRAVACKPCHGPFGDQPARFKGLKFGECSDCHADAHPGQLTGAQACDRCHDVNGFLPVLFDGAAHTSTRFALEGAHRAIACNACHKPDPKLKEQVPPAVKRDLARKGRPLRVSSARLALPDVVATSPPACTGCHADVHAGQFARPAGEAPERVEPKACGACHAPSAPSFTEVQFRHEVSRFPLTGKHAGAACGSCHVPSAAPPNAVVYRPMPLACASCHEDEHVGQLAGDCRGCHSSDAFKPATFDHARQSAFRLEGKHGAVECVRCHQLVKAPDGDVVAQYKPVPQQCGACHVDQHDGAFDPFYPELTRCDGCHAPAATGWLPAQFEHGRTGFALSGKHAGTRCAACHGSDVKRAVPATCAGCHRDPHAQEFGMMCAACHDTVAFRGPAFPVDAHRRTAFPLSGRHASLPCDECHVEKRDKTFTRAALDCAACHAADARRASLVTVDHQRAPFAGVSCGSCHVTAAFWPGRFPQHEPCFPLAKGVHAPVQCNECHANLIGARFGGTCSSGVPVLCTTCHAHTAAVEDPRHAGVSGYEFKSPKCASCHRDGG